MLSWKSGHRTFPTRRGYHKHNYCGQRNHKYVIACFVLFKQLACPLQAHHLSIRCLPLADNTQRTDS
jgi:hypothetical protein